MNRQRSSIIILGHGTRRKKAGETFFSLVDRVACRLPHARVVPACFSCGSPSLQEQTRFLVAKGSRHIVIFPYFLLSGKHIADELPGFVDDLVAEFPLVRFELLATMEDEPLLEEIVVTRLLGHIQEGACRKGSATVWEKWEECLDGALGPVSGIAGRHAWLLQQVARATGDLSLVLGMQIHERAVEAGCSALREGKLFLYDSAMIAAGLPDLLSEIIPSLPPKDVSSGGNEEGKAEKMCTDFLRHHMGGAVIALGENPALLDLVLDLVGDGVAAPALVIGLPVGFVIAPQAKKRLADSAIVSITNAGPKGGASSVVAVLSALASTDSCGHDRG